MSTTTRASSRRITWSDLPSVLSTFEFDLKLGTDSSTAAVLADAACRFTLLQEFQTQNPKLAAFYTLEIKLLSTTRGCIKKKYQGTIRKKKSPQAVKADVGEPSSKLGKKIRTGVLALVGAVFMGGAHEIGVIVVKHNEASVQQLLDGAEHKLQEHFPKLNPKLILNRFHKPDPGIDV